MTKPELDDAKLKAFNRWSLALAALDEYRLREAKLEEDVKSAEAEMRQLARRKP
jgi:DTW domain-containing protein YfiP